LTGLHIDGISKRFRGRRASSLALDGVSLEVGANELLVLLGPSGCGKSTLLRCAAGLERPDSGRIVLGSTVVSDAAAHTHVPTHRRDLAMVFQNYALWPHMSVRANVEYPLRARRTPRSQRRSKVDAALDLVQVGHLADRLPGQLSGGQQQRVSLARALVATPGVLLLDEPLSNLDQLLRVELRAQLRRIHREVGFTGIYVTHDQSEALSLGTRVAVMDRGRVEQVDTPTEVFSRPATETVATFLGIRNRLSGAFSDGLLHTTGGTIHGDAPTFWLGAGPDVAIRFRNVDAALVPVGEAPEPGRVWLDDGVVTDVLYEGVDIEYVVTVVAVGDAVRVVMRPERMLTYRDGRLQTAHAQPTTPTEPTEEEAHVHA
jgi:iron(III) transport system ATP-binding protein